VVVVSTNHRLGLVGYLLDQVYLQPHPKELMLRNHV
jgi:carboxylesterase type B